MVPVIHAIRTRNHRLFMSGTLAFAALLGTAGCDGTTYQPYRYKETVVVETPQGIRIGSTVIEVHMYKDGQSNPFAHGAVHGEFKGEAAEVDLPNGRALFALLTSPTNYGWAKGAYQMLVQPTPEEMAQPYDPNNTGFDIQFRRAMALRGPQVLPRMLPSAAIPHDPVSAYPWLVTFSDIRNPASVQAVDPDNLAANFGPGYKLKSIVLEKTDELVSGGISHKLQWLGDYPEPSLKADHDPRDWSPAATLTHGDFSTFGVFK
eukprot:gene4365-4412_t